MMELRKKDLFERSEYFFGLGEERGGNRGLLLILFLGRMAPASCQAKRVKICLE